jgi:RNA polymerase sigma-70 factor (ECF subfamily)
MDGYGRVVAAVTLVCGSRASAEDAVQEALRRAWERGQAGELIEAPTAWVAVVAMNLAKSGLRRKAAERRALDRLVVRPAPGLSEDTLEVMAAVRKLPKREREAIVLHYWLDMSVEEIGTRLDVTAGAVKNSLFRARRSLNKALTEEVEA